MSYKKSLQLLFDFLISILITLLIVASVIYAYPQRTENTYMDNSFYETYKTVIVWQTEYNPQLERDTLAELEKVPREIFESWLSDNGKIYLVPNQHGYLDENTTSLLTSENKTTFTVAYNDISSINGEINHSYIYVLSSSDYIRYAILHEFGHYVFYKHFGIQSDYILPNYEKENSRFVVNIKDNDLYYADPNEYFAEIFAYTVTYGPNVNFTDSFIMQRIINDF